LRPLKIVKETARRSLDDAVSFAGTKLMQHLFVVIHNGRWEDRMITVQLPFFSLYLPGNTTLWNGLGV
jgi:hypothetical protein